MEARDVEEDTDGSAPYRLYGGTPALPAKAGTTNFVCPLSGSILDNLVRGEGAMINAEEIIRNKQYREQALSIGARKVRTRTKKSSNKSSRRF